MLPLLRPPYIWNSINFPTDVNIPIHRTRTLEITNPTDYDNARVYADNNPLGMHNDNTYTIIHRGLPSRIGNNNAIFTPFPSKFFIRSSEKNHYTSWQFDMSITKSYRNVENTTKKVKICRTQRTISVCKNLQNSILDLVNFSNKVLKTRKITANYFKLYIFFIFKKVLKHQLANIIWNPW